MKRPLLFPVLGFASGIAAAELWPMPMPLAALIIGLGLIAGWRRTLASWPAAICVWAGCGALAYRATQEPLDPDDLAAISGGQPVIARLRGELVESPSVRLSERRGVWVERTVVRLRVNAWRPRGGVWQRAAGDVAVSARGVPGPEFFRAQRVEITGVLSPPPGPAAPGMFDYESFLRRQGVRCQLLCDAPEDWALAPDAVASPPMSERFLPWARERLGRGLPDDEARRLIWAMLLGWRTALNGEVEDVFLRSGTMHVFAISGLHITLIAVLLVQVLRLVRLGRAVCGLVSVPLIWFYVMATGWQPSAVRSAIMTTVVVGTWAWNRPGDLLNSLAGAGLALLVWEPGQLFQAGFQLSFGVVAALAAWQPRLEPWVLRALRFDPDPLLPDEARPAWERALLEPTRWLARGLSTGLAALLASLPVTVHSFHLLNPISLLANLVVVPLSSLVLVAGFLSLCLPAGTELWNAAAWVGMHGMIAASRWCASVPGGWWHVAAPPWIWWVPYGALAVLVSSQLWQRPAGRRLGATLAAAYLAAIGWGIWSERRETRIVVLESGETVWLDRTGRAHDWLIDCGNDVAVRAHVIPFLQAQGVNRLARFAASHGDVGHVGGAPALLAEFRPGEVVSARGPIRSAALTRLLEAARTRGTNHREVAASDLLGGLEVLHPEPNDRARSADDQALALGGIIEGWSVLLTPDLGVHGQRALALRRDTNLTADVWITSPPRDGGVASPPLLEAVRPRALVVAAGRRPATDRVTPEARRRIAQSGVATWFTEDSGALLLRFRANLLVIEDARGNELAVVRHGNHH
jgi:competence protein ComEC